MNEEKSEYERIREALEHFVDVSCDEDGDWRVWANPRYTLFVTESGWESIPNDWIGLLPPCECVVNHIAKIEGGDFDWDGRYSPHLASGEMDVDDVYSSIATNIVEYPIRD